MQLWLFIGILLIPIIAQMRVTNTFKKYAKVYASAGITGAQAARRILDANGLYHVGVQEAKGFLSDHYNPLTKTVHLSSDNFHGHSIAGLTVAAHEVGHAIQDETGYAFLRLRHRMVPVVNFSSRAAMAFIMIGILFTGSDNMLLIGILLMAIGVLFQFVTLPVEFDASKRALVQMRELALVDGREENSARNILNAAAMTYVAATAAAVMQLLRLVLILQGRRD